MKRSEDVTDLFDADLKAKWQASAQALAEQVADSFALVTPAPWSADVIEAMAREAREGAREGWGASAVPRAIQDELTEHAVAAFVARLERHASQVRECGHA